MPAMAAELFSSESSTVVLVPGPDPQIYFGKGLPIFAFTLSDCLLQPASPSEGSKDCWETLFNIASPDREQGSLWRTHCGLIFLHVMARCSVSLKNQSFFRKYRLSNWAPAQTIRDN
jgi:hypothetical protein